MQRQCRIEIDLDKCVGSRICAAIAPDVFGMNEDGQACVLTGAGDSVEIARMAAEGCPVSAIVVEEIGEEAS